MGFGWQELLVILVIALLLFGGTRLAGIGKASGRAIREFKEETRDLKSQPSRSVIQDAPRSETVVRDQPTTGVVDGEVVEQDPRPQV